MHWLNLKQIVRGIFKNNNIDNDNTDKNTNVHYQLLRQSDDSDRTIATTDDVNMSQESICIVDAMEFQEETRGRKRKYLMWGLGAICVVAILIGISVMIFADTPKNENSTKEKITFDDIVNYAFYPRPFNGTWLSDHEISYHDALDDIYIFDVPTQTKKLLVPKSGHPAFESYSNAILSPNRKYILLERNPRKLYRHSYVAEYFVVDVENKTVKQLVHGEEKELQLVVWVPKNEKLVFVSGNNIFFIPDAEKIETYRQLTNRGKLGIFYNGIPDWVYEEEVFSSNKALWFSPSGKNIAFATFNDSRTRYMQIPYYGTPGDLIFQYPIIQQIRYPKCGTPNPIVQLLTINLEKVPKSPKIVARLLSVPDSLENEDPILSVVEWATDDALIAFWMNRVQNQATIVTYDVNTGFYEVVHQIENKHGWLDLFTPPIISSDGSKFLMLLSQDQGNNSGSYAHVTLFDRKDNATQNILTKGKFCVLTLLKWDEKNDIIYYVANQEDDPAVQHLYKVRSKLPTQSECITCTMPIISDNSLADSDICLKNVVEFSTDNSYFIWSCDGPSIPFSAIYSTDNLEKLFLWEDNKNVQKLVQQKDMPQIQRFKVAINDEFNAQVRLLLPPNLDTSGRRKYPLLVKVYAGPGSFQVEESFGVEWESYLASSKDFVIAQIDGRGSGLKGDRMMQAVYRSLGTVEIYDQINVTRYIQNQFDYIDKSRTAVWGWSYGGYATGMILAHDQKNIFKCGISVAAVTDWALYDSIYTERYMGLPKPSDNLDGYEKSQLLNKFESLRNKTFLVVHGTMDDNVHFQQSLLFARVLERNDIMFRQLAYTDEDHGLAGVRKHLYHNLENFLDECLDLTK